MGSAVAHQGFGTVGNAHAGHPEHRNIVGAVADGDDLLERDPLAAHKLLEHGGFALSIEDGRQNAAGHYAVGDFQLVGVHVIDAEGLLQVTCKKREAAGENGGFVAEEPERADEAFRAVGEGNGVQQGVHAFGREAAQEGDAAREAFVEIQLAAHGSFGNAGDLIADACHFCQLVDHLRLNQGGIHVEGKEPAVTAEDALALEGDVDGKLLSGGEKVGAHGRLAQGFAADCQLHTGCCRGIAGGKLIGKAVDAIDIHLTGRQDGGDSRQVVSGDRPAQHRDDEVLPAPFTRPRLQRTGRNTGEMCVEIQLACALQELGFESRQPVFGRSFDEHTQRKRLMHDGLANIENADSVPRKDAGQFRGEAGVVVSGKVNEYGIAGSHLLPNIAQGKDAPIAAGEMFYSGFTLKITQIQVKTTSADYRVYVGRDLFSLLTRRIAMKSGRRILVLTSPEIWALWGRRFLAAFPASAQPTILFLPAGERFKRMEQVERLAGELAAAGADRSSLLVAFGGGIVGDLGGFLAAIYMRGIEYVQVPTTLLAQVDSSVGGKTGVNLVAGKNLIGSFHHPAAVFADLSVLQTLPERELRAGLFESVKAGIIRDADLFRFMERNAAKILARDPDALRRVISASIRMKAEVVGIDERESGLRMILNFGHTIGHAIEAVTHYRRLLHGEAIAWGMLAALRIGLERGTIADGQGARMEQTILAYGPLPPFRTSVEHLLGAAGRDKKNRAGTRRFVLPRGIGDAVVVEDVTDAEIAEAARWVLERAR